MGTFVLFWSAVFAVIFFSLELLSKVAISLIRAFETVLKKFLAVIGILCLFLAGAPFLSGFFSGDSETVTMMFAELIAFCLGAGVIYLIIIVAGVYIVAFIYGIVAFVLEVLAQIFGVIAMSFEKLYNKLLSFIMDNLAKS